MVAALIPAYQAEPTVGRVAGRARALVDRVLVVDDGSRDGTGAAAARQGAEVIRHAANRGKGAALRSGFARLLDLGAGAVVTLDADGQHDPEDIPSLVAAHQRRGADLVIGTREGAFGAMTRGRRFGNRFSCSALRFFAGLELPDSQSGFRLYAAAFLRGLPLRRDAYDAEVELLLHAARGRARIACVAVRTPAADGAPTSHFRPWLDTYRICRTVVHFSVCTY